MRYFWTDLKSNYTNSLHSLHHQGDSVSTAANIKVTALKMKKGAALETLHEPTKKCSDLKYCEVQKNILRISYKSNQKENT
jgi:hypothetical protein